MSENPDRSANNNHKSHFDTTECLINRRSAVTLGASLLFGTSGCLSSRTPTDPNQEIKPGTVFRDIGFESTDLLVKFFTGHHVEGLNLIGPTGEVFRSTPVALGEILVRIPILQISPEYSEHYTPGLYKLVVDARTGTTTLSVNLIPEIKIAKINQFSGIYNRDRGNLEVTIENNGTGPTWVYEIGYRNSPNRDANIIGDNPGGSSIYLQQPESIHDTIIQPGSSGKFVSRFPPFVSSSIECKTDEYQFDIIVRTPTFDLEQSLNAKLTGDRLEIEEVSLRPLYTCEYVTTNR